MIARAAGLFVLLIAAIALADRQHVQPDPAAVLPTLDLSDRQKQRIGQGRSVFFEVPVLDRRFSAVAFRVHAPEDVVWAAIGDFDAYPQWIDGVERAEVYRQSNGRTYVEFDVAHWLIGRLNYSARHDYPWPSSSWGTFELDEARESDFESASGFWRTFAVAEDSNATDVVYAAYLVPSGGVARWFRGRFVRGGLKSATEWLPREAEASFRAREAGPEVH